MPNMNAATDADYQIRQAARLEQRLHELASDNADAVERGDMTAEDANALYVRTADRLMHDC